MKKIISILTVFALLFSMVSVIEASEEVKKPEFSLDGGLYVEKQTLTLTSEEGTTIYYTTDGNVPTEKSKKYTSPIILEELVSDPKEKSESLSSQWTNQSRESSPIGTVIRAIAVDKEGRQSFVETNTYIVNNGIFEMYKLPVVAITATEYDLWDEKEGIYRNFNYEHNVPAYVEYFDAEEGKTQFSRNVEIKVSGNGSRDQAKKSLRIYFNKGDVEEGKKSLKYELMPAADKNYNDGDTVNEFGKLTLRISDWRNTDLHDVFAQKIGEYMRVDTAASIPTAVFLNGEFWGMYECREQHDNTYIKAHYDGISKDEVVMFNRDWTLEPQKSVSSDTNTTYVDKLEYSEGPADSDELGSLGESYYRDLFNYIKSLVNDQDISDEMVYAELCQYIDIDNFIDYMIVYMYSANDDWPGNNFRFWRTTEEGSDGENYGADGKLRFIIHDFDIAFDDVNHNTLYLSIKEKGDVSDARHPFFATEFLEKLMKNESFKEQFIQRFMVYLSTALSEESITNMANSLVDERRLAKEHDLMRWDLMGFTPGKKRGEYVEVSSQERLTRWEASTLRVSAFAKERPTQIKQQIIDLFGEYYNTKLSETKNITFKNDTGKGFLEISGAPIKGELYGEKANNFVASVFCDLPIFIKANANEGFKVDYYKVTMGSNEQIYKADSLKDNTLELLINSRDARDYTVEAFYKESTEKYEDVFLGELKVLREGAFDDIDIGESRIINVMGLFKDGSWQKVYDFDINVAEGESEDVLLIDKNKITSIFGGKTVLDISYKGHTIKLDVNVNPIEVEVEDIGLHNIAADSEEENRNAKKAFDKDVNTFWKTTQEKDSFLSCDLDEEMYISSIDVTFNVKEANFRETVLYSSDAKTWKEAKRHTIIEDAPYIDAAEGTQEKMGKTCTYFINDVVKYVKIEFPTDTGKYPGINEVSFNTECNTVIKGLYVGGVTFTENEETITVKAQIANSLDEEAFAYVGLLDKDGVIQDISAKVELGNGIKNYEFSFAKRDISDDKAVIISGDVVGRIWYKTYKF